MAAERDSSSWTQDEVEMQRAEGFHTSKYVRSQLGEDVKVRWYTKTQSES